jgi:DNA invertase Pin-like site-specific DNA recombinase
VTATATTHSTLHASALMAGNCPAGTGTVYGYARVSTNEQNPKAQSDRLRAYGCASVLEDHGVSGAKASRPQWDKLLDMLQPGDVLVCVKLDRIGRSVAHLIAVAMRLRALGVELVVLDQNIDTRTPTGTLLFHMLAAIAEFERALIIERTRDGQAVVRTTGNMRRVLGGQPPLGFRDPGPVDDKGRDWVLDEPAAQWLRDLAQLVLDDPEHRVARAFASLPAMRDAAGQLVNVKMARAALQRPASAGLLVVDGNELGAAEIGGPLDSSTFNRLRVVFGSRKTGRPVELGRFPFGPLLRCSGCGNKLTGITGWKGRAYYGCRNPHKIDGAVVKPCRGVSVPADDVHELLRAAVDEWSRTPAALEVAGSIPRSDDRRAALLDAIGEQQESIGELMAKRQQGYISRVRYDELSATAAQLLDAARAELCALDAIESAEGLPSLLDWDAMTEPERRRAVERAVQLPIVVQPGNGGARARGAAERVAILPARLTS